MTPEHLTELLHELDLRPPRVGRVLAVDDEEENLVMVRAVLGDAWEVLTATGGQEALALLEREGEVDLVLSDQRMPGMTGSELLARIAEKYPETVRVMLTAYSDVEPMVGAINQGAVFRFLLKPYAIEELRQVVAEAMEQRASRQTLALVVEALLRQKALLERSRDELDQAQRLLLAAQRVATMGGMMSGVVHDLRGMASILSLLLAKVRRVTDDPEVIAPAERAWEHLDDLLGLLGQVLTFARQHPGQISRELVDTDLFCRQTLELFAMEPQSQGAEVDLDLDPAARWLHVDPHHLRQGLLALLRNAVQASQGRERAAAPQVRLTLRLHAGRNACVEVADQGHGMDAATVARATEPFFSAFDPPGLGLGLEVARLAAEYHGGSVELESDLGSGTRARLYLAAVHSRGAAQ